MQAADDGKELLSVKMNAETSGDLCAVESKDLTTIHERRNTRLAQADGMDVKTFIYSRAVYFVSDVPGLDIPVQTVPIGDLCVEPQMETVKSGFTLCGWSKNGSSVDWDFAVDTVQEDITLYARWEDNIWDDHTPDRLDTEICIDILNPDSYVYTGKAIVPRLIVWDGNKVLTEGVDYKVSYKNNVNACDITDVSIKNSKKPQAIVQGIGNYKASHKFVEYFSIQPANVADLDISMPDLVAAKANNKKQTISPVVKTDKITVSSKSYTVSYYRDEKLENGLTKPGDYYVVVEAKKDSLGVYTGNLTGRSEPKLVRVIAADKLLSKAKVTPVKNIKINTTQDSDTALQLVISQMKIGSKTYSTKKEHLGSWRENFSVSAIDYDGTEIPEAEFYKVVHTAGTKTIVIRAREENTNNYVGEISVKITVAGIKLKKGQFQVSYDAKDAKAVMTKEYTSESLVPNVYTDLAPGTDYTISYKSGKKVITAEEVVNAGKYTMVITGIGSYSGSLSYNFTISKVNLATAYANGKITIEQDNKPVGYHSKGAQKEFTISYDADGTDTQYASKELTDQDIKITFSSNKKITGNDKLAYASVSGKGNFTGTLKGDGKEGSTSTKKGIAPELNYAITTKSLKDEHIRVLVKGLTKKKGKVTGASIVVYDQEVKVASSNYKVSVSEADGKVTISLEGKGNYTETKTVTVKNDLIKTTDSKKVRISYVDKNKKYYWTGETHRPEIVVEDITDKKNPQDITNQFDIIYGENTKCGQGTITVVGKPDQGYCEQKVLKFMIYPKWLQWIFK